MHSEERKSGQAWLAVIRRIINNFEWKFVCRHDLWCAGLLVSRWMEKQFNRIVPFCEIHYEITPGFVCNLCLEFAPGQPFINGKRLCLYLNWWIFGGTISQGTSTVPQKVKAELMRWMATEKPCFNLFEPMEFLNRFVIFNHATAIKLSRNAKTIKCLDMRQIERITDKHTHAHTPINVSIPTARSTVVNKITASWFSIVVMHARFCSQSKHTHTFKTVLNDYRFIRGILGIKDATKTLKKRQRWAK